MRAQMIAALLTLVLGLSQFGASRTALATVADTRGRAIVDIEADDFVVRETGGRATCCPYEWPTTPLPLVLDNGPARGRTSPRFARRRRASSGASVTGRSRSRCPIRRGSSPPSTTTVSAVMQALEKTTSSASGEGLFQAIVDAAHAISENGSPFSAIVVVSASPLAMVPSELLTPILESGATVHVDGRQAGVRQRRRSTETLRALADQTHGQFTTIYLVGVIPGRARSPGGPARAAADGGIRRADRIDERQRRAARRADSRRSRDWVGSEVEPVRLLTESLT